MSGINDNPGSGRSRAEYALNAISVILIGTVFVVQVFSKTKASFDDFGLTEWLINYSGGFVRRGLPGSVIHFLFANRMDMVNYFVIGISAVLYISFLFYFIISTAKLFPVYVTLSPILMGAPVYGNFWMRKDVLGLYFLVLALALTVSKRKTYLKIAVVNLILIVSLLSHEAFAFYGLPAVWIVNAFVLQPVSGTIRRALFKSAVFLLPAFLAFLLVINFRGNQAIALKIHNSWSALWISIDSNSNYLSGPDGSIRCLQRSASAELGISAKELTMFSHGIYVPLAVLTTICLCFILVIKFISGYRSGNYERGIPQLPAASPANQKKLFVYILFLQFLFISPLFVLAIDYGRWIFFWMLSSVIIFRILSKHFSTVTLISPQISSGLVVSLVQKFPFNSWLLLLLGIPLTGWSVHYFVFSSPLGSVLKILTEHYLRL